jgi:hypothetical protein
MKREFGTERQSDSAFTAATSRHWAERVYSNLHWNELDRGSHFAAFEQPELSRKSRAIAFSLR